MEQGGRLQTLRREKVTVQKGIFEGIHHNSPTEIKKSPTDLNGNTLRPAENDLKLKILST